MENWNIKEETGKQYVYVSKLGNDDTAKAFFGYANVWQSDTAGTSYVIGDRRRDSAVSSNSSYTQWKCIANHTKGATAPNADATNWAYDVDNYQEYLSTKTYAVGSKTVYGNEHYTCTSAGTTGTFDLTKWTKNIVSNSGYPWLTPNTVITMINGGTGYNSGRFVSYEAYDYTYNLMYHNIYVLIGLGTYTLSTVPTKYLRVVGLDKLKTIINSVDTYSFYPALWENVNMSGTGSISYIKVLNSICSFTTSSNSTHLLFAVRSIFLTSVNYGSNPNGIYHCVENIFVNGWGNSSNTAFGSTTTIKNNYFASTLYVGSTVNIGINKFDYNCYKTGVNFSGSLKSTIADIKAADTNQNKNSILNAGVTFTDSANGDYTLPNDSSPLYRTGAYGRNIGCTNIGFKKDETTSFLEANGAIFKNIKIDTGRLVRAQINKAVVTATNTSVTLAADASSVDEEYTGMRIKIVSGASVGNYKTITAYNGTTKVATTAAWGTVPDNTSVYDILDGEVTSAKIDLGRVVRVKSANFFANFISDVNGKYVEVADMDVTDGALQPKLTFEMNYSTDDVTYSGYKKFLIDEPLRVDSNGYGNGDGSFVRANQLDGTLNIRYCYIKIGLREI